ncbi:MAG TPA: ribosome silencing factor [Candidatus Hydrothermia bacterium]|nr:ribosome silencing factor [Candidatus Hydrothermae bacterium]MDD3648785.1 ribosome silencing factor [Candidatus Hydrothermia bacterium]MDD5572393.1 ribosome silencing factor [Candidatus Hydrothermia bacterium]HOK23290.1 ribosome silencing factor [Candidatus Hydrothermia bacterium]HOL24099.1 ribosome silencing factor [Candidatus Hydrothermia bacterium]
MENEFEFGSIVEKACEALYNKKAEDIKILEIRKYLPQIADFFVLATANSAEHMNALRRHLEEELANEKITLHHVEGTRSGARWVLLDYNEVIIHIMLREAREFYRLEELWNDVPRWSYHETFERED